MDLSRLSLEELAEVQVTSVSKRPEAVGEAPSAIFVITGDAIARSGASSLPEMLRLAPNLQVYQTNAHDYVVTARGMNGNPTAQNFSNKLLVMIDGRSVYTPLFSGVYWDMQGVAPADIDRIEVVSGPGATLWGANAVNGVINIITRNAADTQGLLVTAAAGDRERRAAVRFGGRINDALTYRIYASSNFDEATRLGSGARGADQTSRPQAGFRIDWTPGERDTLTLQGDGYNGFDARPGLPAERIRGRNVLTRWSRDLGETSNLQVQAYFDRARRSDPSDRSGFRVDTYDLDLAHTFTLGTRHQIVWGGGYRVHDYRIAGAQNFFFRPASRKLELFNVFVQDSISLGDATTLVLGAKVEDDAFVSAELLPNARLSWTPREGLMLWGAVSRAIRSPTPFDHDVVERFQGVDYLIGGPDFRSEALTAYELGAKLQPNARTSVAVTAFYNRYRDLRSIERAPAGVLPLRWGNRLRGETYGAEAWADVQVADGWRLSGSVTYLDESFAFEPGASGLVGVKQVANDPKYQAQLKSAIDLAPNVTLDAQLRYVSALPEPRIPDYLELNGRLGWRLNDQVQLGVSARNLLHDDHVEYVGGNRIPRSILVDLQWRF